MTTEEIQTVRKRVQTDHLNGDIKIARGYTYRRKTPKPGHIFYRIKYTTGNRIIYQGAYCMNLEAEKRFQKAGTLTDFLLDELAKQLY